MTVGVVESRDAEVAAVMPGPPEAAGTADIAREMDAPDRLVPLDALRGVAIALVIFHHVGLRFPSAPRGPIGDLLVATGWAGVDIFFSISGFLITGILLRASGRSALKAFYTKRLFRIVPLYLVALVVFLAGSLWLGNDREVIGRLWMNALFLTAWVIPFVGENGVPFTITWSVSVEEFAYLLLGAVALFGARRFRHALWVIAALALLVRALSPAWLGAAPITMYYFAPARIDAIAFGGLAALAGPALARRAAVAPWIPALLTAALIAWMAHWGREDMRIVVAGYSLLGMASAWLVLCVARLPAGAHALPTRVLASLGLVSYFVYLFHEFVIAAVGRALPAAWDARIDAWLLALTVALLTWMAARVSWAVFELPLIHAGRRIARARWGAAA